MMATVPKYGEVINLLRTCFLVPCILLLQMSSINCQTFDTSSGLPKFMLPFYAKFPTALRTFHVIKIMGFTEEAQTRATWVDISFLRSPFSSESPFYLKMRFDNQKIIRTSFQGGNWGEEQSDGPFPFTSGSQFLLLIYVQQDGYKVIGNGVPLWSFPHRGLDALFYVRVTGDSAGIRRVELIDEADENAPRKSQVIYPVPLGPKTVDHPSFPFWGNFLGGLQAGKAIRLTGIFPSRLQRATINLWKECFNGPVVLHIDLRFAYGNDVNRVVRNVYLNGAWGNYQYEERSGPFPFHLHVPFDMTIAVQADRYDIEVDGLHCWTFKHRLPFTDVTAITIERGPMAIWSIQYKSIDAEEENSMGNLTLAVVSAHSASSSNSGAHCSSTCAALFISVTWSLQMMFSVA